MAEPLTWIAAWKLAKRLWPLWALILLAAAIGYYGHVRYEAGVAAVEARWEAQRVADAKAAADAQAAADARLRAQTAAANEAAQRYIDAQTDLARLTGVNRDLLRRLRDALARSSDPLPRADPDPAGAQPAGARIDARAVANWALDFSRVCAESRDRLAAQVNGLIEGWPR